MMQEEFLQWLELNVDFILKSYVLQTQKFLEKSHSNRDRYFISIPFVNI